MVEQLKKFTLEFFRNLKCDVSVNGDILIVENVPKSFEDLFGKVSPYKLSFSGSGNGLEFVGKGSQILTAITKFLEGAGKATILRIDFDVDPEAEIKKRLVLKNCDIGSLTKGYKNNFFSRFSFVTSFNYLNESERLLSEIYVHGAKIVEGDLSGYTVVDGEALGVNNEHIKRDYSVAKERSIELSKNKQGEVSGILKDKVEAEIDRIRDHYDKQLKERGCDLNGKLEKIREVELELRSCSSEEKGVLRKRLDRLRDGIVKAGDDEAVTKVLKEREMTVKDAMHKYSLNVERKLVNTTVIYYPVYTFKIYLERDSGSFNGSSGKKFVEVSYDPLTKVFGGLDCEGCGKVLDRVSLCDNGHVCCDECLGRCGECAGIFCVKCLKRSCGSCGKKLCKSCVKICFGCGGVACATHLRKDCVSGEDRCVSCLRACLRCHLMCEEKFFGEAMDGSKVCGKCLGVERQGKVLEDVFQR